MSKGECPACGTPNFYENVRCSECGANLPWSRSTSSAVNVQEDRPSVMLNVFSLLIPLVGIAAWLILMGSSPKKSAEAGISALIGILVVPFVLFVLLPWLARP